ncbi:hypothetical protein LUZ60_007363 [Juncus effusus]|nr:hypothetical protein LUZ60_007363 [Juncus effusus]
MATQSFQLRLNPLTGDSEWLVINEEENISSDSKCLLANTSYLDMLNDSYRNFVYRRAIEAAITEPCHVIDIGAGTGLLSMMAARAMEKVGGEREGHVSACESYLPMVKLMRKVIHSNGLKHKIKLFPKRSDEVQIGVELDSQPDVLVSEILDSELLGEGLIPTLQHAHDNLLVRNPKSVPYRATTFGQLVECEYLWRNNDLHSQETKASDGIFLSPVGTQKFLFSSKKQYAMHCDPLFQEMKLLSEPFEIFEFDFWRRPESKGEKEIEIKASNEGKIHAVISWWVLQLDEEGKIFYSTAPNWINSQNSPNFSPGKREWCDHWKQCVWFIQNPGNEILFFKDQFISLRATHNETSISYNVNLKTNKDSYNNNTNNNNLQKAEKSGIITLLPERIALYGDKNWREAYIKAIKNALDLKKSSPVCLVADDSVFLTSLIASLSKSSDLIASFPGLKNKGNEFIKYISSSNDFSLERIRVTGARASCLTESELDHKKIDLFVGEPFYYGNESLLPWQNLRFWREKSLLDPVLAKDALILPCKGILKICAFSLPDLWRSRRSLKEIEGFDHSIVNETLGACGDLPEMENTGPMLPFYLWQCGQVEELSEIYSLMEFDFSEPFQSCFGKLKMEFSKSGICHGFALWIDWSLNKENSIIISTGPDSRYWKQGIRLLNSPVLINNITGSYAKLEASFDHLTGEITMNSSFSPS